jgi:hypothetical protein
MAHEESITTRGVEQQSVRRYVERFVEDGNLATRITTVLCAIDEGSRRDLMMDPRFRISVDLIVPGTGRQVWMSCPHPNGGGSRSVVLKQRLAVCGADFAHYVIAHELAHACLRNGGWGGIEDAEEAADALAAKWGFARPQDGTGNK